MTKSLVLSFLSSLPLSDRQLLVLYYYESLSLSDISLLLSLPESILSDRLSLLNSEIKTLSEPVECKKPTTSALTL
jgi:DNA-directed RNA polymerase specialized sigma24 family protein